MRACLEGFAAQSVQQDQFEIVIADDGSEYDVGALARDFDKRLDLQLLPAPHQGVCSARNRAIHAARAPLLVLHDDDQKPNSDFISDCIRFHAEKPDIEDCLFLPFELSKRLRNNPVVTVLFNSGMLYTFPKAPAIYDWAMFWSGAISCKAAIFEHGIFNSDYPVCEDTELAIRLGRVLSLRIHYDKKPRSVFDRAVNFQTIYKREMKAGYYRARLREMYGENAKLETPLYRDPDSFLLPNADTLSALGALIRQTEAILEEPETAKRRLSDLNLLASLYQRALAHAIAVGQYRFRAGEPAPS